MAWLTHEIALIPSILNKKLLPVLAEASFIFILLPDKSADAENSSNKSYHHNIGLASWLPIRQELNLDLFE